MSSGDIHFTMGTEETMILKLLVSRRQIRLHRYWVAFRKKGSFVSLILSKSSDFFFLYYKEIIGI